jgi:hypothetical protein
LYLLLVGSAILALWARRAPGQVPGGIAQAAPWLFLVFIVCFGAYRLALVRARKYPVFKAFFQVGAAALFFMLLMPGRGRPVTSADELELLMVDASPTVRALAVEVAGHREGGLRYAKALVQALEDPDPRVRERAHASLVQLAGTDLGNPSQPGAVNAWQERFR